jgi:small subunit ribosomal protein S4
LCRREGEALFLKGERCSKPTCAIRRREKAGAPGQHGTSRKKVSEYGRQLREKQKAKRIYGILEAQFRNYYEKADKQSGITGENLLALLETRLDNVVYRMGFGRSRTEARQVVRHNHITVNGKKVNIPSYHILAGDEIAVKDKSKTLDRFKLIADVTGSRIVPAWISSDLENLRGTALSVPTREQIDVPVFETLIVELYSK